MILKTSRFRLLRSVIVVLLGLAVGLPLLGVHPWNGGLKISPATTVVTSPVDASGMPDYAEYFNSQHRAGSTPENNAAAILLGHLTTSQIDWSIRDAMSDRRIQLPQQEIVRLREAFRSELGLTDVPAMPALIELRTVGERSTEFTQETFTAARSYLFNVRKSDADQSQPLSEHAWLLIEQWVLENEDLRQRLVSESHRTCYYYPLVPLGRGAFFADIGLTCINHDLELCHLLRGHAELRLRSGELEEAATDAMTLLRYASLYSQANSVFGMPLSRIWANDALAVMEKLAEFPKGRELARKELRSTLVEFQREFRVSIAQNHLPAMQSHALSIALLLWSHGELNGPPELRYPDLISINSYLRQVNALFDEARPVLESGDLRAIRKWVNEAVVREKPVPSQLVNLANRALRPIRRSIILAHTPQMMRHGILSSWSNMFSELEAFERMDQWLVATAEEQSQDVAVGPAAVFATRP